VSVRTLVIVNPRSRIGVTKRRWRALEAKLRSALGSLDVAFTLRPRDAERIAREGVRAGIERIVVAGGDGTISEVTTGLLSAELAGYASVGILPLGTGCDFARSIGLPRDLDAAIESLADGSTRSVDVGRVTCLDDEKRERTSYFANIASFGISGVIDQIVNDSSKLLGGRISFLLGTLRGLSRYRSEAVSIRVDGELIFEGPLVLATAANGRFFAGGMPVAPNAQLDDGQFDIVVIPELSKHRRLGALALATKLPQFYRGSHLRIPQVRQARGRVIEAQALGGRVPVDVDGEQRGSLPARFEILPDALTLFGC